MSASPRHPRSSSLRQIRARLTFVSTPFSSPQIQANAVLPSYGSVLATHLIKTPDLVSRISSIILVDPVSILLNQPDVIYNFVRLPLLLNQVEANHAFRLFASRDTPMNGYCGISDHKIQESHIHWDAHSSGLRTSSGRRIFSIIPALCFLLRKTPLLMQQRSVRIYRRIRLRSMIQMRLSINSSDTRPGTYRK